MGYCSAAMVPQQKEWICPQQYACLCKISWLFWHEDASNGAYKTASQYSCTSVYAIYFCLICLFCLVDFGFGWFMVFCLFVQGLGFFLPFWCSGHFSFFLDILEKHKLPVLQYNLFSILNLYEDSFNLYEGFCRIIKKID